MAGGEVVAGADAHGDEAVRQARPLLAGSQGWDPQPGGGEPDEPADAVVRRQPGAGEADEDGGDPDDLEGGVHERLRGGVWAGVLAAEGGGGGGRGGGGGGGAPGGGGLGRRWAAWRCRGGSPRRRWVRSSAGGARSVRRQRGRGW